MKSERIFVGSLWISEDAGDSFTTVSANLPPIYGVRFAAP